MPFNIGPGELIIILIIALVVLGPGKLPDVGQRSARASASSARPPRTSRRRRSLDTPCRRPRPRRPAARRPPVASAAAPVAAAVRHAAAEPSPRRGSPAPSPRRRLPPTTDPTPAPAAPSPRSRLRPPPPTAGRADRVSPTPARAPMADADAVRTPACPSAGRRSPARATRTAGGRPGRGMSLVGHLAELRTRILWSLLAIAFGSVLGFASATRSSRCSGPPSRPTVRCLRARATVLDPAQISIVAGIILAMPVILYQVWAFIAPGPDAPSAGPSGRGSRSRSCSSPWASAIAYVVLPFAAASCSSFLTQRHPAASRAGTTSTS